MQVRLLILNKAQLTQLTCEAIAGFTPHIKMSTTLIQTLFLPSAPQIYGASQLSPSIADFNLSAEQVPRFVF